MLPLGELGEFLKLVRADRPKRGIFSAGRSLTPPWNWEDMEDFEAGTKHDDIQTVDELKPLLDAYGATPILVEWMAADSVKHIATINKFSRPRNEGVKCTYQFPDTRLEAIDI